MRFRLAFVLAIMLGMAAQPASAQYVSASSAAAVQPRKVISWVPPYGIAAATTRLKALYGGYGPRNALTHLALQFWVPTPAGGLARSSRYQTITNANIQAFVAFGHSNGIKVLLCVYNGEFDWDWSLTQAGINHQTKFIDALINEMQARNLDGIDIDLEGPNDQHDADKPAYIAFVKELARRVHLKGKIVTVDTFPWKWNAPNWNWWPQLFPKVDGINSMGYEELGRTAPTWQSYAAQKAKAGQYAAKLQIGLPSYLATWQGDTTLEQVQWFRTAAADRVGIAIWDAQFPDTSWTSSTVWQVLRAVRRN